MDTEGYFFICGKEAYLYLPEGWFGSCYLTFVFPQMTHIPKVTSPGQTRARRSASWLLDVMGVMMPSAGVALNSMGMNKLAQLVEDLADEDASAFGEHY